MNEAEIINLTDSLELAIAESLRDLDSDEILELAVLVKGKENKDVRRLAELIGYDLNDERNLK